MQLEWLINRVEPSGEILDQSFLTYENTNIGFKIQIIESLIGF